MPTPEYQRPSADELRAALADLRVEMVGAVGPEAGGFPSMTLAEYQMGYYSLIQFCPNLSRMETANVGVVLLVPEARFVKARVASAYAGLAPPHSGMVRVLLARSGGDTEWLNDAARGVAALLEAERESCLTAEGLALFAAKMANDLLLTPPRPVKVRKPETELNRLFEELVL